MAVKINAGDVGRADLFLIDPDEIDVNEALNGRWQPHSEDEIDNLAKSILEDGQLQPVQVRKVADNRVQLVLGYRRYLAVTKINKGRKKADHVKLKCILTTVNDEEAFRKNITENKNRKNTSPVDDAVNQRRLREEFGWNDTRIAEFYGCSPSMVSVLKKVLLLPDDVKARVHKRELALNTAIALVDLTPEEQVEVLKPEEGEATGGEGTAPPTTGGEGGGEGGGTTTPATKKKKKGKKNKGGTPGTATVLKRVRKIKGNKEAAGANPGKKTSRSMAEVRRFFEGLTGPGEKKAVRETAEFILKFVGGTYTDDNAEKKFKEVLA
jgi:ParB/RepB/Spo0J family partition protein